MRQFVFSVILGLTSLSLFGQRFLLKPNNIDTLNICIRFGEKFPMQMQEKVKNNLTVFITEYNTFYKGLIVLSNTSDTNHSLIIEIKDLRYVDLKRNLLATGLDLIFLATIVNGIINTTVFIPLFLAPAIVSQSKIYLSQDLIISQRKTDGHINASAFWVNKEKQELKFLNGFDTKLKKLIKKIERQNKKR